MCQVWGLHMSVVPMATSGYSSLFQCCCRYSQGGVDFLLRTITWTHSKFFRNMFVRGKSLFDAWIFLRRDQLEPEWAIKPSHTVFVCLPFRKRWRTDFLHWVDLYLGSWVDSEVSLKNCQNISRNFCKSVSVLLNKPNNCTQFVAF